MWVLKFLIKNKSVRYMRNDDKNCRKWGWEISKDTDHFLKPAYFPNKTVASKTRPLGQSFCPKNIAGGRQTNTQETIRHKHTERTTTLTTTWRLNTC